MSVGRFVSARFLVGVSVSALGDWLTTFALAVVLYGATGSVAATAGYFLVRVGPRPLGAWLGGPLGDVVSPRVAILGAALSQGALTAAIALPLAAGRGLWAVYLLAGLSQLIGGSWQPLTAALMSRLAAGKDRHTLNLVYILLSGGAIVVSPAVGALLLPVIGAVPLVLADAVSFLFAAGFFLSLPRMPGAAARHLSLRGAAFGGFAVVLPLRILRVIALGAFSSTVAITALQTALPALALQRFGSSADAGVLYASVGFGSMGGSLLALWPAMRRQAVILPGLAVNLVGIGLVGVARAPVTDLLILAISTAASSLAQVEGGVVVQSRPQGTVGRVQGAVSTSRFIGMAGGAAISLGLAVTVKASPQMMVLVLALVGLVILLASAIGPRDREPETRLLPAISPLTEFPE